MIDFQSIPQDLRDTDEAGQLAKQLRMVMFLVEPYNIWWWSIAEIFRKLFLTGLIVLIFPGTSTQALVLFLLTFLSLFSYQIMLPYTREANILAICTAVTLHLVACSVVLLRIDGESFESSGLLDWFMVILLFMPIALYLAFFVSGVRSFVASKLRIVGTIDGQARGSFDQSFEFTRSKNLDNE